MEDLIKNFKQKIINKMKRILIIVLCFVLLNKATAQADKVILDNVFQNINKATIPTGYLQDYGVAFVKKESYNGLLTDSNAVANLSAFRSMYNNILSAKINPTAPKNIIIKAEFLLPLLLERAGVRLRTQPLISLPQNHTL